MVKHEIDRKTLREDTFRDTAFLLIHRAYEHRKKLIAAGILIVAIGVGTLAYKTYSSSRAAEESASFFLAETKLAEIDESKKETLEAASVAFRNFLESYPDGNLAPIALMYQAQISWELKNYENVIETYKKVRELSQTNPTLNRIALIGLAKTAEVQGNPEQAAAYYAQLGDEPFGDLKNIGLGRLALQNNQPEEARKYYDKVASKAPPTALSNWASQVLDYLP